MKFQPTQDRVLFQRAGGKGFGYTDAEGVLVPSTALVDRERCKIIATGPKCQHVEPGMTVIIPMNEGMKLAGVEGLICRESGVLAIVEAS